MKQHDPRLELRIASNGATVIAERPYSINPEDSHLRVVLTYWDANEGYVTWIHNTDDCGYHEGNYFHGDTAFKDAFNDYIARGVETMERKAEPKIWLQRGDDGFWLMMRSPEGQGAIHLKEPEGSITRKVFESCVTEDVRIKHS